MPTPSNKRSPRRPPVGEVIGATVAPRGNDRPPRPITVQCEGHAHHYEIAWEDTENGPVITDLRIFSPDGTPITKRSLARINPDRIAAAAKRTDTEELAEAGRMLKESLGNLAESYGMSRSGFEWTETFRGTSAGYLAAARKIGTLDSPRRGRPALPPEHFESVAELAREAHTAGSRSIARYIAQRMPYGDGSQPAIETVNGWLKRCKKLGLIEPGELRKPRQGKGKEQ
ncbi:MULTISPECIES: hypothetical protein [Rhodococcus]|uniref:hypothetical protein n=1 Tax=Rhodococcus TaxID=1827 RepID=UPI001E5A4FC0|nr:hypothetical protein [Rhodococcus pyridinivorans]MCD2119437.1 hypothetical protein [Rhodococcus pyridinivorans]MCZ4628338.1 hypothetical protein [Rhodococcus pyridinivorans]MCZ4649603.1 hypothetical protein [Rhodococcus pyridinivorans]MDJ0483685.1 hypothetical protein [Rhodococcus pyridinivorans]MDV7255664.1 hypothetical protein [Rhodococcus pyridinivorans]